jgi:hypothetical protein
LDAGSEPGVGVIHQHGIGGEPVGDRVDDALGPVPNELEVLKKCLAVAGSNWSARWMFQPVAIQSWVLAQAADTPPPTVAAKATAVAAAAATSEPRVPSSGRRRMRRRVRGAAGSLSIRSVTLGLRS